MTIIGIDMIIIILIIINNTFDFDLLEGSGTGGIVESDDDVDGTVDVDVDGDVDCDELVDDGNADDIVDDGSISIFLFKFESNIPTSQANCFW